jgi:hypothetical protein
MSDSSNPMVNRTDDETEPTPYDAGSSANSLGAPAPDPDKETAVPDDAETPNTDIHGDPEQVS